MVVLYDDQPYEYFQSSFNVSQDRQWMIEMNIPIDPKLVNSDSLSVVNSKGEAVQIRYRVSEDNKKIKLIPNDLYKSGEIYLLTLSKELKTPSGKPLKVPVRMIFTVK
ncbi:Ig-like domain-containing protein [Cytobacillus praedii]|uniref:Ig-like domain-containing protein n=1 Tax=Cytobacillus praedii TaxID=1742358 RepID=UPI003BFA1B57